MLGDTLALSVQRHLNSRPAFSIFSSFMCSMAPVALRGRRHGPQQFCRARPGSTRSVGLGRVPSGGVPKRSGPPQMDVCYKDLARISQKRGASFCGIPLPHEIHIQKGRAKQKCNRSSDAHSRILPNLQPFEVLYSCNRSGRLYRPSRWYSESPNLVL